MKAKRVVIVYLNNGNLESQVAKEFLFNKVVNDFVAEGRVVTSTGFENGTKTTWFKDGSRVYSLPFGKDTLGMRFTHLYVDEKALVIPKADEIIDEVYKSCVVNGDLKKYDTSDENRVATFNVSLGKVNLKTYRRVIVW
jgi:hypothetical protein